MYVFITQPNYIIGTLHVLHVYGTSYYIRFLVNIGAPEYRFLAALI